QAMVVTNTTVGNFAQAGSSPSPPKKYVPNSVKFNKIETTPDTNMADISLQALIRHQNQRRININPVPAPNIKIISNNCNALVSTKANKVLQTIKITVAVLPTATNCFSDASLLICCL